MVDKVKTAVSNFGDALPAVVLDFASGQEIDFTTSSVESAAAVGATMVRLHSTVDCHYTIKATTATAVIDGTSAPLPADTLEYVACDPTHFVGAIGNSLSGTLTITPASENTG